MHTIKQYKTMLLLAYFIYIITTCFLNNSNNNKIWADVLYLNDGEEKIGSLLKIQNNKVYYKTLDGKELEYSVASVANIIISKIREGDEVTHISEIKDEIAKNIINNLPDVSKFPDAKFIKIYRKETYKFNEDMTVTKEIRSLEMVLKEEALELGEKSIDYYSDLEKVDLVFAHTYDPSGKVFHVTDDAISEESIFTSTPEYDKYKTLRLSMKNVKIGSVIDYCVRKYSKIHSPLRPYLIDILFESQEPFLHREIEIKFPSSINLSYKTYNWSGDLLPQFLENYDEKTNTTTWRWIYKNPKGYIPEPYMASSFSIFPRILIYKSDSWSNIANELKNAITKAIDDEKSLNDFIREIKISDKDNDLQKAIKVHKGILDKIRWISAQLFYTNDFYPVPISVTLKKRYASNYGRVILAHALLNKLGIKSEVGFIANWETEIIDYSVPNIGQAFYALLKIFINDKIFYCAFNSDYLPFGEIEDEFSGANAIFLNNDNFYFEKIPAESSNNRVTINIFGKLDNKGNLEVINIRELTGCTEALIRSYKSQTDKERNNTVQKILKNFHQNAELQDYIFSDLSDFTKPLTTIYRFKIPEFAIKASDKIMAFENIWQNNLSKYVSLETRNFPVQLDYFIQEISKNIVILIPEGYKLVKQNRSYSYQDTSFSYACDLISTKNILQFSEKLVFNNRIIKPGKEYENFRNCVFKLSELAKQWIILEKIDDSKDQNSISEDKSQKDENMLEKKIDKQSQNQNLDESIKNQSVDNENTGSSSVNNVETNTTNTNANQPDFDNQ